MKEEMSSLERVDNRATRVWSEVRQLAKSLRNHMKTVKRRTENLQG